MPSTWKEDSIARKFARRCNDDENLARVGKNKNPKKRDWLVVDIHIARCHWWYEMSIRYGTPEAKAKAIAKAESKAIPKAKLSIRGEYKSEFDAKRACTHSYMGYLCRSYYCHRSVFELMAPHWKG